MRTSDGRIGGWILKDREKTFRLGLYEKAMPVELSWEERFMAAKKAGYDFIELSIDESDFRMARLNWGEKEIQEVLDGAKKVGLGAESICFSAQRKHPLGSCLEGAEEKAMEILQKVVLLAMRMGIRIIQLQGYDCYYGETTNFETKERFFRNLKKATEFAAMYGVTLAMETMENDFMNTIEKAMYYVTEINSPYLQVYPDIGNISNATSYVCKDIRMGKGHIASAHLKETVPGKFREIPFGAGQVDFPSALKVLSEQGVRRFVAECWHLGEENWQEILENNRKFLEMQFEKAFAL